MGRRLGCAYGWRGDLCFMNYIWCLLCPLVTFGDLKKTGLRVENTGDIEDYDQHKFN
jgi:hypothetical protein